MIDLWARGFPKVMLIETHGFYFRERATDHNERLIAILRQNGWHVSFLQQNTWKPLEHSLGSIGRTHLLALRTKSL